MDRRAHRDRNRVAAGDRDRLLARLEWHRRALVEVVGRVGRVGRLDEQVLDVGPVLVTPQAILALWPRTTPGALGNETPATSYGQAVETTRQWRAFMYQMLGIWTPRWGSFARRAFPVALCAGPTTQLFEPTPGWPERRRSRCRSRRARRCRRRSPASRAKPARTASRQADGSARRGRRRGRVARSRAGAAAPTRSARARDRRRLGRIAGHRRSVSAGSPRRASARSRKSSAS